MKHKQNDRASQYSKIAHGVQVLGFKRVPSSVAYNAIKHLVPELNERTWRRNWKPFYETLVPANVSLRKVLQSRRLAKR